MNSVANARRIAEGQRRAAQLKELFDRVERQFQVEREIIIAIWGIETDFGNAKDRWDVIRSLSTLAYVQYRPPYFRNELLVALKIMQDGHIARGNMLSSWAGAMGQTQFMPTNFVDYAIDFSGDGKADIWTNVPDAMGSTGNYLKKYGWVPKLPWGFEVIVPANFDYRKSRAKFSEWDRLGVRRADGKPYPPDSDGILFFPAGHKGPAFIATHNFENLKEYNNSDAYAIAVGHMADRIAGGPPLKTAWPPDDHQLSREARIGAAEEACGIRLQGAEVRGPHRLRPARLHPRRASEAGHGPRRHADPGAVGEARAERHPLISSTISLLWGGRPRPQPQAAPCRARSAKVWSP